MKKIVSSFCVLFLFLAALSAQDYLGDDVAFFEKKARLYQHWLNKKDLGQRIKVDSIQLRKNGMELELWLSLQTTDPDSAAAIWSKMVTGFQQNNPGKSLQESLLQTFVRMMEIPPSQGNVQIYFPRRDKQGYNKCFYVWLWEENGRVEQEERINNCKALPMEIEVDAPVAKTVSNESEIAVYYKQDRREVFERILTYARQRYEHPIDDRNPQVGEDKITDYSLEFSVMDLSREVLTEERKSWWCGFVEEWLGPCNDMRRERLEFTFNFIPTETGYLLKGEITGKFGSGIYRPRKSGYMDMEPDFQDDFLEPYINKFQKDLKKYLEIKKP